MRIALIGPILPFRGGIAQHTTMLHRALGRAAERLTVSFTRQYPSILFPGENEYDPGYKGHSEPDVRYILDPLNPLTWRSVVDLCLAYRPDALVLPWWTVYWAPCFGYIANKCKGEELAVIVLCHNAIEHETAAWKKLLTNSVLKQASSFMVQSRQDQTNLRTDFPDRPVTVCSHPIYDHFPNPKGLLPRKAALELLFYGFIRPYKGLDILVEAMGLSKGRNVHLTIVGEFWGGKETIKARIRELGLQDQIELIPRYVTEAETAEFFHRADVVVLPYRQATGSGVIPLAYRYQKPVIVTCVGGLPDVVIEGQTGLVIAPNSAEAVADALLQMSQEKAQSMKVEIKKIRQTMTWDGMTQQLLDLVGK